jgi:hypothetical protein
MRRRVLSIEFRVEGKDSGLVAEELATNLRTKFGVDATIQQPPPVAAAEGEPVPVRGGFVEAIILVVHVAIVAHAAYEKYVREPYEKAVGKWQELVFFAKEKRPTLIRLTVGGQSVALHDCEPEKLHEMTKKALDNAVVTPE